jgi:uncharacterized DUF497 family protein
MNIYSFEWDEEKNVTNKIRHKISFEQAQEAFFDTQRLIIKDELHSESEERLFCIGKTSYGILTVRFTIRANNIRIIGAGHWRKWRKFYEEKRKI